MYYNYVLNTYCLFPNNCIFKELQVLEDTALPELKSCVCRHQAVLRSANEIQRCFSEPILAQFTVSTVIICVTAYQLAVVS